MKVIFMAFLSVCFFGISCKKDKQSPPFQSYLKFTVDGTRIECNEFLHANSSSYDGIRQAISLDGKRDNISIELNLFEDQAIVTGQYIFSADTYRRGIIWIGQKSYYAGDEGIYNNLAGSGKITITEISNDFVKGTFDFKTGEDFITHVSKNVTDGEFYMKLE